MSSSTSESTSLTSKQRDWLKKMGALLKAPISGGSADDIPLGGAFPEILWEQKQSAVQEADSMLAEMEEAQLPKAALLRKGFDEVATLEQKKKFSEAIKALDALEPEIKAEFEKLEKARSNGVQDLGGVKPKETGDPTGAKSAGTSTGQPPASAAQGQAAPAADPNAAKYAKEVLKVGSKGPAVEFLQKSLGGIAVDGKFGPGTQKAVKAFQTSKGLKADGIVGPKTWAALGGGAAPAAGAAGSAAVGAAVAGVAKAVGGFIGAAVGKGGKNLPEDVKAVQDALNKRGGANLAVDGNFSSQVQKAIEEFQKKLGQFKPDGVISPGRGTARALSGSAKIPPTPPEPKPIAPPNLGKATLDKGAFVWHSTRGILETNIGELKKGVLGAYGTEHDELLKAIDGSMGKLNKVVDKLDTRLADALDAAYKAADDQSRVPELKKAQGVMNEYLQYVKSEPLIDHMDDNPFGVKTSLKKVITDALDHLSELLPEPVDVRN